MHPVENIPNGYPRLATFQTTEQNYSVYRGFAYLHTEVLLEMQTELTELEKQLDDVDWDELDVDEDLPRHPSLGHDVADVNTQRRAGMLRKIREKLVEYGEYETQVSGHDPNGYQTKCSIALGPFRPFKNRQKRFIGFCESTIPTPNLC